MVNRTLFWDENQSRTFDYVQDSIDTMIGISQLAGDVLGQTATVVSGLAATASDPANLSISIAAGSIYQLADIDATTDGAISQNTTQILQQGIVGAQTVTLSTTGIAAGQSQWHLIEAQFSQSDVIRSGDPNGGLLYFYNSTTPTSPFEGPNGDGATTPTERQGLVTIQVITGSPATTGSETPPSPSEGWTPLYLVDLSYGQTTIIQSEIHQAGPSVGTGVPDNYQAAPFLAGLTNSHHGGVAGQAPQIKLASEVQGTLPMANLPASDTYGEIAAMQIYAGNPNGHVAGNAANEATPPSMCWDTTGKILWTCTSTGTTAIAVWSPVGIGNNVTTVTANATLTAENSGLVLVNAASGDVVVNLPAAASAGGSPLRFRFVRSDTTTNTVTVNLASGDTSLFVSATSYSVLIQSALSLDSDGVSHWVSTAGLRLIATRVYSTAGVTAYVPTPGTTLWDVEVAGAGGGTGGLEATTSTTVSLSYGGSSGAYARSILTGVTSCDITVGAPGAAGASSTNGGNGGTSSFGAYVSSPGGGGGPPGGAATIPCNTYNTPARAGTPSGWNVAQSPGNLPTPGIWANSGAGQYSVFSAGGAGPWGQGSYGAGADGIVNGYSAAAAAGVAAPAPGCVIVREYC